MPDPKDPVLKSAIACLEQALNRLIETEAWMDNARLAYEKIGLEPGEFREADSAVASAVLEAAYARDVELERLKKAGG